MSFSKFNLILRSFRYNFRDHLGLFLSSLFSACVLVGALTVGDSVKGSLEWHVRTRLGSTTHTVTVLNRFFRTELASDLGKYLSVSTSALLRSKGVVSLPDNSLITGDVHVNGIDANFMSFAELSHNGLDATNSGALIDKKLALRLGLKTGDAFLVRVEKNSSVPAGLAYSIEAGETAFLRLRVSGILGDKELGCFSLDTNQAASMNVFLSIEALNRVLGLKHAANTILLRADPDGKIDNEKIFDALQKVWLPEDAGLVLEDSGPGRLLLKSSRLFIKKSLAEAALTVSPRGTGIFSYFVNAFTYKDAATPYSFIQAPPPDNSALSDDEILLSDWLAADLKTFVGETITLTYFVLGGNGNLSEVSSSLKVKGIRSFNNRESRMLYTSFPGLTEVENCGDWSPGIPINLKKIREKDKEYWEKHGSSPKAWVSLKTAQRMWANEFGSLTAILYKPDDETKDYFAENLCRVLRPSDAGFVCRAVLDEGLGAGAQANDFGSLFLGLSLFIILSALLLSSLLFLIEIESRGREIGLFIALGYSRGEAMKLFLVEILIVAFMGSVPGGFLGVLYNQLMIIGLNTVWQGAVNMTGLTVSVNPLSILVGTAVSFLSSFFVFLFGLWMAMKIKPAELHRTQGREGYRSCPMRIWPELALISICGVLIIFSNLFLKLYSDFDKAGYFFFIGGLTLALFISFWRLFLKLPAASSPFAGMTFFKLIVDNLRFRRKKSFLIVIILSLSLFIVFAVGTNYKTIPPSRSDRTSGTGGFAMVGETTLPIFEDLNNSQTWLKLNYKEMDVRKICFYPFRVHQGDEASCLNLNRVENPRMIGVEPSMLAELKAFSMISGSDEEIKKLKNFWYLLDSDADDSIIPAIADDTVITWSLRKRVGDLLTVPDEQGRRVKLQFVAGLASSVFQGSVLISERNFRRLFPSTGGYNFFLVEGNHNEALELANSISSGLRTKGAFFEPATERLARYMIVENTYLFIFFILGGIGILIGTIGLGIIVLRNAMEMQGELALLLVVGWKRSLIALLVILEHAFLLLTGLGCGLFAAIAGSAPQLFGGRAACSEGFDARLFTSGLITAGIIVFGLSWIVFMTFRTLPRLGYARGTDRKNDRSFHRALQELED